jgi:hypothetical protein
MGILLIINATLCSQSNNILGEVVQKAGLYIYIGCIDGSAPVM